MEKQKQEALLKQQQQQQQVQQPGQPPAAGRRNPGSGRRSRRRPTQLPGQGAASDARRCRSPARPCSRASPRVQIDTPTPARLDLAARRADRRPRADQVPRDGRSEIAADRAAVAARQPASVLRRVRLGRGRRRHRQASRPQHGLDAARLGHARRRQAGHADLGQRRRARVPPHPHCRRQVPAHGREPGRQQGQRPGHALSLRADPPPRHAGDARLLHPARRPDRRAGRPGSEGVQLQGHRGQEEHQLQGDQRLARPHRQVLGGDAAARSQGRDPGQVLLRADRRAEDLPDRLSRRRADRRAGRHRPRTPRGCSPAPRKPRWSTATTSSSASTASSC